MFFQATIIDDGAGRVTAAAVPRGGDGSADLFVLTVDKPGRSGFVWSRVSVDGESKILRGACEKAG